VLFCHSAIVIFAFSTLVVYSMVLHNVQLSLLIAIEDFASALFDYSCPSLFPL